MSGSDVKETGKNRNLFLKPPEMKAAKQNLQALVRGALWKDSQEEIRGELRDLLKREPNEEEVTRFFEIFLKQMRELDHEDDMIKRYAQACLSECSS